MKMMYQLRILFLVVLFHFTSVTTTADEKSKWETLDPNLSAMIFEYLMFDPSYVDLAITSKKMNNNAQAFDQKWIASIYEAIYAAFEDNQIKIPLNKFSTDSNPKFFTLQFQDCFSNTFTKALEQKQRDPDGLIMFYQYLFHHTKICSETAKNVLYASAVKCCTYLSDERRKEILQENKIKGLRIFSTNFEYNFRTRELFFKNESAYLSLSFFFLFSTQKNHKFEYIFSIYDLNYCDHDAINRRIIFFSSGMSNGAEVSYFVKIFDDKIIEAWKATTSRLIPKKEDLKVEFCFFLENFI
jgi:hypothetical protein